MSPQHTPEPWTHCKDASSVKDADNHFLFDACSIPDAHHIVACVNACAGIEDESLWILADNDRTLKMYITEIEQQRDELAAMNADLIEAGIVVARRNVDLLAALKRMEAMHNMMMKKVNHGASFYNAECIREMNEAPKQAAEAIAKAGG